MNIVQLCVVFLLFGFAFAISEEIDFAILQRLAHLEATVERQNRIIAEQSESLRVQTRLSESMRDSIETLRERQRLCADENPAAATNKRFVMNSEGPVAFTTALSPHIVDHVKPNEIIKFDTVVTDIGSGYNNQSGVFVVPVSGIYLISSSLLDHPGAEHGTANQAHGTTMVRGEIVHNGSVVARVFAHGSTTYRDQGAQTVVIFASPGDQIWVRTVDNNDLALGGDLYSTFSGYLLYPM